MNPAAGETDEAYRHFSETLEAELVANVKPVIMSLTMLAEDYSAHSAYIARAIEEYILKVRPELKILGLYLMDSIMKNLKQTTNYIKIFEKNIVSVFCRVFSAVDESQRRALYKLRQTWNVLFSNAALLDLDKSVQQLDPAWPITATTSSSSLPSSSSSSSTTANSRVQQQATTSVIKPVQQLQQQPQPQPQTQPQQQQQQQLKKVPTPTPIPSQTQPQSQQQKQPNIEPATQPSTVPTITTMMNKTTVAAPVVRDRDPRLIRAQQQQQQPSTATVIRSSGGGQISPPSTKSSESSTDLSIGGGGGVKPTQSSSMTAIGATQSTQSSPSKPASSALVNLKRTSTSDLHPKVEAKKPKMIVVSPPPDKDPTNQILPPPVKPPAASKTTSPKTGAKTAAAAKAKTTTSPSGKTTTTATKTSTKVPSVLDLELNPEEKPTSVAAPTKKVKNESVVKTVPAKQPTATTTTTVAQTVTPASQTSTNNSKAAAIATLKNAAKLQALVSNTTTKPPNTAATTSTTGVKSMLKRLQNTDKILAAAAAAAASTQTQLQSNQNHTTSTNHNHNNSHKTSVVDSKQSDDLLQPLSDVDERFGDVDERFIPPTSGSTATKTEAASSDPIALAAAAMKNLFESSSSATTSLANITNHPTTSTIISALLQSGNAAAAAATSSASSALPQTIPTPLPVVSGSGLRQQTSSPPLSRPPRNHDQENSYDQQQENLTAQAPTTTSTNSDEYVSYEDLPALRPRDSTDSLSDSLLIIDGRQYRLAANTARKLHIYYHDHEVLCDTRSKDVYVDKKRVAKMGDPSKEVTLNGRRVRIMYMGQRVEVWIDGMAYQFRADSPPKPISLPSTTLNGVIKRYYVTVDSRTMEMFFNNYRVCQIDPMSTATLSVRLAPDDFEQHEISFVCPPKMIMIDDTPRKMRYDLPVPCIEMPDGYHAIKFDCPAPKSIFIDDLQFVVPFNRSVRIRLNGRAHELAWGGPGFEVIIDGRPYELQFDKSPREILIGMRAYSVCIKGEPPDVKVLGRLPPELLDYQQQSIDASAAAAREISSQNQPPSNNNQFANNTGSSSIQQPAQQPTAPNVQDLVKKLFDYKILQIPGASSSKPSETSTSHPPPITTVPPPTLNKPPPPIVAAIDEPKTPDLTSFDSELLKIKYPAAIKSLYLGQQCATCGNRFPPQQQNGGATINRYARHLDWHFRQNKKEKLEANKAHSRAWYYSLCEWSLYEELSDEKMPPPSGSAQATGADKYSSSSGAAASSGICTDGIAEEDLVDNGETSENGGANSGSTNSNAQNSNNQTTGGSLSSGGLGIIGNGIRTCPASDDVDDSCCICNDPFEIFWFAEKEEWHFKDAIRVDNKLYHPICFEDAREEEHNNSSINLSRSQSFMDSETTTNATTAAAPISPPSPLNSSDNIDMEHSGLIRNVDNINSDDKLVKVEPL